MVEAEQVQQTVHQQYADLIQDAVPALQHVWSGLTGAQPGHALRLQLGRTRHASEAHNVHVGTAHGPAQCGEQGGFQDAVL